MAATAAATVIPHKTWELFKPPSQVARRDCAFVSVQYKYDTSTGARLREDGSIRNEGEGAREFECLAPLGHPEIKCGSTIDRWADLMRYVWWWDSLRRE